MTEPYDTPEISGSKYAQQPNDFLPYLLQHNDYCCPTWALVGEAYPRGEVKLHIHWWCGAGKLTRTIGAPSSSGSPVISRLNGPETGPMRMSLGWFTAKTATASFRCFSDR